MDLKKGASGDNLWGTLVYILVLVFAIGMLLVFISGAKQRAGYWEDYYAKQLSLTIDSLGPGTYYLDVTQASVIASKTGQRSDRIFTFDNINHQVTVSLRPGGGTSYQYLNDVFVSDSKVLILSGDSKTNRLYLEIKEGSDATNT